MALRGDEFIGVRIDAGVSGLRNLSLLTLRNGFQRLEEGLNHGLGAARQAGASGVGFGHLRSSGRRLIRIIRIASGSPQYAKDAQVLTTSGSCCVE